MALISAIFTVVAWTLHFSGVSLINFSPLMPNQWHANEMIFGFLYSAVIGFLLTASANWTGTRGLHGQALFILFSLFLLTRIIFWTMPFENLAVYQIVSTLVPLFIVFYLARLFIKTKNYRNLILIAPLSVLALSQLLILSSKYTLGYELAIYSVRFLVVVIAGRIIPFFTKKALSLSPKWNVAFLDKLTILSVFLLIFEPLFYKTNEIGNYLWVGLTTLALLLNIYRLINWRFISSAKVGILFVLYLAYAWLPVHFFLNLATHFGWVSPLGRPELHSLVYGSMGLMIIGIINRVTLGHTGRTIHASTLAISAYAFLFLGSVARVFGPLLAPANYLDWIKLSGALWILAFLAMSVELAPKLFSARADGKEY